MKYILVLCLALNNLYAVDLPLPKSKRDCFTVYTLFKALVKTCQHADYYNHGSMPNPKEQEKCVRKFHASFITECQAEAGILKKHLQ